MDNTDNIKKYKKIRRGLELVSLLIALIVGQLISSSLGIYGSKFFSLDTAATLAIIVIIGLVFDYIFVQIADNWYERASNK